MGRAGTLLARQDVLANSGNSESLSALLRRLSGLRPARLGNGEADLIEYNDSYVSGLAEPKLKGQVALVTGAGRGLGRTYAHRLSALGARVAVLDLNLKSYADFAAEREAMEGDSTVSEIEARGGEAIGLEVDVTNSAAVNRAIEQIVERWEQLDVAVCNAGGGTGTLAETTAALGQRCAPGGGRAAKPARHRQYLPGGGRTYESAARRQARYEIERGSTPTGADGRLCSLWRREGGHHHVYEVPCARGRSLRNHCELCCARTGYRDRSCRAYSRCDGPTSA